MIRSIMIAGLLLWAFATSYVEGQVLMVDDTRTIRIDGAVGTNALKQAAQLEQLSIDSKDDVYLIINSPGGNVATGMQFLNAMKVAKSRDIKLVCVVPVIAASMAFHYLAECDERYAFSYSLLLWHPMKIGGMFAMFSADEMEYLIGVMRSWELPLNNVLIDTLDIDKKLFYYHYKHETLFTTIQLQEISPDFIKVIEDVKGVDGLFKMK